jgi:prepilin-type N-terminal cleavage/methylation domain-containing protein
LENLHGEKGAAAGVAAHRQTAASFSRNFRWRLSAESRYVMLNFLARPMLCGFNLHAMKKPVAPLTARAFTLVELLVVIAIIAILIVIIIPTINEGDRSPAVHCMNNLRQVNLGFLMWLNDNWDRLPWQVSVTNNGTLEVIADGHAYPHFQVLSNIVISTSHFVCPTDKIKREATNYAELTDRNISYFVNLVNWSTNPVPGITVSVPSLTVLAGDRHLQVDGQPVKPGLFILTTNADIGWTLELHGKTKMPQGVLAYADGHCAVMRAKELPTCFQEQNLATNRLVIP